MSSERDTESALRTDQGPGYEGPGSSVVGTGGSSGSGSATEIFSCGRCQAANAVPSGLIGVAFQCHRCGATSCVEAPPVAKKKSLLGKLARKVDKTLLKVDKALFSSESTRESQALASPPAAVERSPSFGLHANGLGTVQTPDARQRSLDLASSQWESRLEAAEVRTAHANRELAAAQFEISALQQRLLESEHLVEALTEQLEVANAANAQLHEELAERSRAAVGSCTNPWMSSSTTFEPETIDITSPAVAAAPATNADVEESSSDLTPEQAKEQEELKDHDEEEYLDVGECSTQHKQSQDFWSNAAHSAGLMEEPLNAVPHAAAPSTATRLILEHRNYEEPCSGDEPVRDQSADLVAQPSKLLFASNTLGTPAASTIEHRIDDDDDDEPVRDKSADNAAQPAELLFTSSTCGTLDASAAEHCKDHDDDGGDEPVRDSSADLSAQPSEAMLVSTTLATLVASTVSHLNEDDGDDEQDLHKSADLSAQPSEALCGSATLETLVASASEHCNDNDSGTNQEGQEKEEAVKEKTNEEQQPQHLEGAHLQELEEEEQEHFDSVSGKHPESDLTSLHTGSFEQQEEFWSKRGHVANPTEMCAARSAEDPDVSSGNAEDAALHDQVATAAVTATSSSSKALSSLPALPGISPSQLEQPGTSESSSPCVKALRPLPPVACGPSQFEADMDLTPEKSTDVSRNLSATVMLETGTLEPLTQAYARKPIKIAALPEAALTAAREQATSQEQSAEHKPGADIEVTADASHV